MRLWHIGLRLTAMLGIAQAAALPANAAERAPIHALVIGIDAYVGAAPLNGAVNDARAIARALQVAGARQVVTLTDGQATRARIMEAIAELGNAAAKDSGVLMITYAGHGSQEPERLPGDEADGKDEVLILAGFRTRGEGSEERLIDNDIYRLLAAVPRKVAILFVADACHSGTLTRSSDPRAVAHSTRLARYGPIVDDRLPPPPPSTRRAEVEDLPNVVFVSAALDSEVTPEVLIEGKWHGAVSWYFARALQGDADVDRNGSTTLAEFRQFLVNSARLAAESRQTPGVRFLAGRGTELFPASSAAGAPSTQPPAMPTLWISGKAALPAGAVAARIREEADLIWDVAAGQVIANAAGDMIAERSERQTGDAFMAGVLDKWRALPGLRRLVSERPLTVRIQPRGSGARYADGIVSISVGARPSARLRYLTIVDIAGDGTVQLLFPRRSRPAEGSALDPSFDPAPEARVQRPFGADHVVAIATSEDPTALREALMALEGRQAASDAARAIEAALRGKDHAIGIAGLYTGPDGVAARRLR